MNSATTVKVKCPHCGREVSVLLMCGVPEGRVAHEIARCDPQNLNGGCGKSFVVTYAVRFETTTTKLQDEL